MINFRLLNIYKNLGRQGLPNHNYLLGRVGSGRTAIDHLID